jgi:hypothetical protein
MDVACDACCLINFLAGEEILPNVSGAGGVPDVSTPQLFVPSAVARESLYVLQPDPNDPEKLIKTPIDLKPYFDAGVLQLCRIESEEENDLFVRLAINVDDGEAACLAIAKVRGMTVATDDRPASRLAAELAVPVLNTPEYLRRWSEEVGASRDQVMAVISRIQRYARFIPRPDAADAEWWIAHAS